MSHVVDIEPGDDPGDGGTRHLAVPTPTTNAYPDPKPTIPADQDTTHT